MINIFKPLSDSDIAEINHAIAVAEEKTSAEICPMIVKKSMKSDLDSDNYLMKSIGLCLVVMFILTPLLQMPDYIFYMIASIQFASVLTLFVLYKRYHSKLRQSIETEADMEFEFQGIGDTLFSNGVLLYISLEEKRVVVLADHQIKNQTDDEVWTDLISQFQVDMKNKSLKEAIINAVQELGKICEFLCPKDHNDKNEIKNEIIIKG